MPTGNLYPGMGITGQRVPVRWKRMMVLVREKEIKDNARKADLGEIVEY